jgi:hypothetical protein
MKKGLLFVGILLVAVFLITGTVLVVNAQTPTPETPENEDFVSPELDDEELEGGFGGMMGRGRGMMGVVHEYVINALSEATGLSVEEINERLTNDETLLQIAKDAGLSDEEIKTLLTDAHKAAWEAAGVDTTGTFYQNMVERMKNMWNNRENFQGRGCRGGFGGRMGRWINPES